MRPRPTPTSGFPTWHPARPGAQGAMPAPAPTPPGTRVLPALVAPGMRGRCRGPGLWLRCARVSGPEFSVAVAGGDWHQLTCRCRGRGVAARCGVVPGDGGDPQPVHGGRVDGGAAGPAGEGDGERAVSGAGVADGQRPPLPAAVGAAAGAAPGAVDGGDRQAGAGYQAGEIAGLVGDLQDGPAVWLQPPPDLPVADRQSRADLRPGGGGG